MISSLIRFCVFRVGTGFAAVSLTEQMGGLIGNVLFNMIYARTLSVYSGIVFLVAAVFSGCAVILNL